MTGNFIKFNRILDEQKINLKEDILTNFKIILNLYKKEKISSIESYYYFYLITIITK